MRVESIRCPVCLCSFTNFKDQPERVVLKVV